jgi:proline iminopeptidase
MNNKGFVERDEIKFHYSIEGEGPTTLVIGSAVYFAKIFSQDLRKHLRLVFVDWRGFAELSGPENIDISLDDLLEDIEYIRQKLDIKKCIIMGMTGHGLLALEYAKKYPQYVTQVIMISLNPGYKPDYDALAERYWEESVWPERKEAFAKLMQRLPDEALAKLPLNIRLDREYERDAPKGFYDYTFDTTIFDDGSHINIKLWNHLFNTLLRHLDITKGLDTFNIPVFIAFGRFDFLAAPPAVWDPIRPHFKSLRVRIFERSGHSAPYEEAALFNQEILEWIRETS